MSDVPQPSAGERVRRSSWLILLLLSVTAAWGWYMHHWPQLHTANEAMRLYFIQAVVDEGRPELDGIVARHGSKPVDRSEYAGHIYMDKAPAASLVALPAYPILKQIWPDVHQAGLWRLGWAATWLACGLPLLLMLAVMARWLRHNLVSRRATAYTVLAVALASPVFVYATLYFGHALAAAALSGAVFLLAAERPTLPLGRRRALLAGLLLGLGGLADTPVFVLAGMVLLWAVARIARATDATAAPTDAEPTLHHGVRRALLEAAPIAAGLALGAVAQLAYNTWVLGHPLRFTYQFKADANLAAIMNTGFLGFRPPQAEALVGLWLGPKRGLLYHAPWLAAGAAGLALVASNAFLPRWRRFDAAALAGLVVFYALFVSGFADWPAGDSASARHLLPIVPLLGCGLGLLLDSPLPTWQRALVMAGVVAGVILHAPTVATFPYHFSALHSPTLELSIPLVVQGFFAPSLGRFLGGGEWHSAPMFAVLLVLPWTLAVRLPAQPQAESQPALRLGLTAMILVIWATGMVTAVPKHNRVPEITRFNAQTMLGPSAKQRERAKANRLRSMARRAEVTAPVAAGADAPAALPRSDSLRSPEPRFPAPAPAK
jgi:hypothetical protein